MPADALATLFEALSICFADRHTDTKELLYLCSACTQGIQVHVVAWFPIQSRGKLKTDLEDSEMESFVERSSIFFKW